MNGEEEIKVAQDGEVVEDKSAIVKTDEELIKVRKEKIVNYLKKNYNWIVYAVLALITYLAVRIRTSNLGGLRDVTTGTWTLGPDLDPWFFLRMAEYIVEHGSLFQIDWMRYVPIGFNVSEEYLLHPYMMAWFHKVALLFGSASVTQSAVFYPVFMFALTVIAFFFLTREIFVKRSGIGYASSIALIASFFLVVMPPLLPRTIAGIPEKESAAFLFLFLAFYFFIAAWNSDRRYGKYVYATLGGLSTAAMAHIWGGYTFIFITIFPATLFAFLLGKIDREKTTLYATWLFTSFVFMVLPFNRHTIRGVVSSTASGPTLALLLIVLIHFLLFSTDLKRKLKLERFSKVPPMVISLIVGVLLVSLIASIVFGFSFIPAKINGVVDILIKPATSRLIQTVAENRQPYFSEWAGSFGPIYHGAPIVFWLFFFGSIYLFRSAVKVFEKRERRVMVVSYVIMLTAVIFSRYASDSLLNGENMLSKFVYAGGFVVFLSAFGYYYYSYYKRGELVKFKGIEFSFLLLFSLFFISIIAARATVRTIMVLVPSASIIISYFVVAVYKDSRKISGKGKKVVAIGLVGLIVLASVSAGYQFYGSVNSQAEAYVPSIYNQQWQRAMSWVRESTPQEAVFGHWWDYGYWLQSIGERATVLDGGNAVSYWNHLMGRHVLTATSNSDALEFLYAHNTTHFLIDSTDIGKYSAFSIIGSDVSYDRASFLPTFFKDPNQIQERKNSTLFLYTGGVGLDEDIIYEENGSEIFLPAGSAGLGGILIEKNERGLPVNQPLGVFVYQGQQHALPLRYLFDRQFIDFGSGVEAGVYLFPLAAQTGSQVQIDRDGALIYLSSRTVNSQLARLYLYKEDNPNFKLVHSEDDFFVAQLKNQDPSFDQDIVYFQGIRGPIRIWEIDYPEGIEFNEEYISTVYPTELRIASR